MGESVAHWCTILVINLENLSRTNIDCVKSSKTYPERAAIAEHFCWGNTTTSYKTKKTNLDFCLNFFAIKAYTKVRGL